MNIQEAYAAELRFRTGEATRTQKALRVAEGYRIPDWLTDYDVSNLSLWDDGSSYVSIRGDIETVKSIQRRTGTILQRSVSSYSGAVSFQGSVGKMSITVNGDDLPLAPTCELVPYQETVTRFKVVCAE
jgi:hypothetical protein